MNYAQFLGLPKLRSTRRSLSLPSDFKEKVHIHLMPTNTAHTKGNSPITQLHECNDDNVQHIYLNEKSNQTQHSVQEAPDTMQSDPIETEVNVYGDPCRELGGSVRVHQHTEQQLTTKKSPQDNGLQQRVDDTYRQDQGQCAMTNGLMPGGHSKADGRASTDLATTGHKAKISYDSQAHSRQELGHIEDSGPHKALPQQSDNDVTSEYDHSKFDEWLDQIEYEDF